jgi:hypothetical protein
MALGIREQVMSPNWRWKFPESLRTTLARIDQNVTQLLTKESKLMTAVDDLNAGVATLVSNFATLDAAIQAGIAKIIAANNNDDSAAVEAAAQNILKVSGQMATDAQNLSATLSPPAATAAAAPKSS